jgi:hypothetical protein
MSFTAKPAQNTNVILLGVFALLSLCVIGFQVIELVGSTQRNIYAESINTSGRQRMLSQRTALKVQRLWNESNSNSLPSVLTELLAALDRMEREHTWLYERISTTTRNADLRLRLDQVYNNLELHKRVLEHIGWARSVANEFKLTGSAAFESKDALFAREKLFSNLEPLLAQLEEAAGI